VYLLARNYYISGGKYSGVDEVNSYCDSII
jgi:hypothetical protein